MLEFEGNASENSRIPKNLVVFENEDNEMTELDSNMASVTENDWEANIDTNMSASFYVPPSVE